MKLKFFASVMVSLMLLSGCLSTKTTPVTDDACSQLGWELAVHSYTFRMFPISQAIKMTHDLGLKYMSLSGHVTLDNGKSVDTLALTDAELTQLLKQVHEAGLTLVNIGVVGLDKDEKKSRRVFDFAKKAGINVIISEPDEAAMDTIEKLCKEYNIRVAIHDHPKPSHYWNPDTVLAAIKGHGDWIGACADVGHWKRSGLDPVECLKKLDGHIIALHFKDLVPEPEQVKAEADGTAKPGAARKMHDVPWGTGESNMKAMMAELQRQKFHGAFCIEYEYHWTNSYPEIAQSVKYFEATAAELVSEKR